MSRVWIDLKNRIYSVRKVIGRSNEGHQVSLGLGFRWRKLSWRSGLGLIIQSSHTHGQGRGECHRRLRGLNAPQTQEIASVFSVLVGLRHSCTAGLDSLRYKC